MALHRKPRKEANPVLIPCIAITGTSLLIIGLSVAVDPLVPDIFEPKTPVAEQPEQRQSDQQLPEVLQIEVPEDASIDFPTSRIEPDAVELPPTESVPVPVPQEQVPVQPFAPQQQPQPFVPLPSPNPVPQPLPALPAVPETGTLGEVIQEVTEPLAPVTEPVKDLVEDVVEPVAPVTDPIKDIVDETPIGGVAEDVTKDALPTETPTLPAIP